MGPWTWRDRVAFWWAHIRHPWLVGGAAFAFRWAERNGYGLMTLDDPRWES